jgi:hypothetical protein
MQQSLRLSRVIISTRERESNKNQCKIFIGCMKYGFKVSFWYPLLALWKDLPLTLLAELSIDMLNWNSRKKKIKIWSIIIERNHKVEKKSSMNMFEIYERCSRTSENSITSRWYNMHKGKIGAKEENV